MRERSIKKGLDTKGGGGGGHIEDMGGNAVRGKGSEGGGGRGKGGEGREGRGEGVVKRGKEGRE